MTVMSNLRVLDRKKSLQNKRIVTVTLWKCSLCRPMRTSWMLTTKLSWLQMKDYDTRCRQVSVQAQSQSTWVCSSSTCGWHLLLLWSSLLSSSSSTNSRYIRLSHLHPLCTIICLSPSLQLMNRPIGLVFSEQIGLVIIFVKMFSL